MSELEDKLMIGTLQYSIIQNSIIQNLIAQSFKIQYSIIQNLKIQRPQPFHISHNKVLPMFNVACGFIGVPP